MILGNATLRTVPHSPGAGTCGSLDVDLEISPAEEDMIQRIGTLALDNTGYSDGVRLTHRSRSSAGSECLD